MEYINKFSDYSNLNTGELYNILKTVIAKIDVNYNERNYEERDKKSLADKNNKGSLKAISMSVSLLDSIKTDLIDDIEILNQGATNEYLNREIERLANEADSLNKKIKVDSISVKDTGKFARQIKEDLELVISEFEKALPRLKALLGRQPHIKIAESSQTHNETAMPAEPTASLNTYKCGVFTFDRSSGCGNSRGKNFKLEMESEKYKLLCNFTIYPNKLFSYKELCQMLDMEYCQQTTGMDINFKVRDLKKAMKLNDEDKKIFICNKGYMLKC